MSATAFRPSGCDLSGGSCSSGALDVAPDGRLLASETGSSLGGSEQTDRRRECDQAILERRYTKERAAELRAASRDLRV